ncbi:hypothetical protein NDU88_000650 [Pleurodeles waltl]|uniref:Uncharacterized protein n=1 Tax=Pleurodeles waltl TaxID=8319 RepID=A0AAV7KYF3_PLEWA|nr:hypothetical protein NDU88_000650 [Pleurodeles waltl]
MVGRRMTKYLSHFHRKDQSVDNTVQMPSGVQIWSQYDDETLGEEYTGEKPSTRRYDAKDLYRHHIFPVGTQIAWDKGQPHTEEHKHAEGDPFGFIEVVWQFSGKEGHHETGTSQYPHVTQHAPESSFRTFIALKDDCPSPQFHVLFWERRAVQQPCSTEEDLKKCTSRNSNHSNSWTQPFPHVTARLCGVKGNDNHDGFGQDARDTEDEYNSKGRLAQYASDFLRFSNE